MATENLPYPSVGKPIRPGYSVEFVNKLKQKWTDIKYFIDDVIAHREESGPTKYPMYDLYKIQDKMRILDSE